jgi:hypothetical protein
MAILPILASRPAIRRETTDIAVSKAILCKSSPLLDVLGCISHLQDIYFGEALAPPLFIGQRKGKVRTKS